MTTEEIRKFLYEAKRQEHPWYPIWATALLTGMRTGELYTLEWDDVDFENNLMRVSKSYNKRTNEIKCTKAGYWRTVPMSPELRSLFVSLKGKTDPVYVLPRFKNWQRGDQCRVLKMFLVGIGLPKIKFHALRACFATQLLAKRNSCGNRDEDLWLERFEDHGVLYSSCWSRRKRGHRLSQNPAFRGRSYGECG